jgi:hypothetical protein
LQHAIALKFFQSAVALVWFRERGGWFRCGHTFVYRVGADTVKILRVWHGAQDRA